MKLVLKKHRTWQKNPVSVFLKSGGMVTWNKVGDVVDVKEEDCGDILEKYSDIIGKDGEVKIETPKEKSEIPKETKISKATSAPKNKAAKPEENKTPEI